MINNEFKNFGLESKLAAGGTRKPQLLVGKAIETIDFVCVYAGETGNAHQMFG